ncbi:MAG: precorrin-2 C(20)-methyltransferase, partial [Chlorobi bacterium]|nr:precorrin-2 C(20)-methyltransferase [Chlorobiota bacterium]
GIGLGPGDPELLTLKAVKIMKEVDIIVVPQSDKTGKSMAKDIISPYVENDKLFMYYFPMTNDADELDKRYTDAANKIFNFLKEGKTVAYVTIGDTPVYSTFNYLYAKLKLLNIDVEMIPGISAFSAVANKAKISLCEKNEKFCVMEMPSDTEELNEKLNEFATVVLMKVHKKFDKLIEYVKSNKLSTAIMVQKVSLDDEIVYDLNNFDSLNEKAGYMSTAVLKK